MEGPISKGPVLFSRSIEEPSSETISYDLLSNDAGRGITEKFDRSKLPGGGRPMYAKCVSTLLIAVTDCTVRQSDPGQMILPFWMN